MYIMFIQKLNRTSVVSGRRGTILHWKSLALTINRYLFISRYSLKCCCFL